MIWPVGTLTAGDFEWDEAKADANLEKHGVSFEQAALALLDPHSVEFDDAFHSDRVVSLALHPASGVLLVVWCEGSEQRTRLISARKAEPHEQRRYRQEASAR